MVHVQLNICLPGVSVLFTFSMSVVFLEQPAALERAPDYRQLPLICSVIEGFGIDWLVEVAGEILSTGSPRQTEQLMNIGIVNSSTTNSSVLTISNGTDMNATCIAFRRGSTDPLECPSRTSQVLFHGKSCMQIT